MCGIIGHIHSESLSIETFIALRDRLAHRGPDDAGLWHNADGTVFLGHRRLSILDLSSAGHQPMVSGCGRFVIVFNGEVYNYLELKSQLQTYGFHFTGNSDTEVVLAAYCQWGDNCLKYFNGMFALAIWDKGTHSIAPSLFLVRDRVGEKPLYYAHNGKTLVFASELKSIPKEMRGSLDLHALNHYLALGYVPGSLCIVGGVKKLPPGHAMRYFPNTGKLKVCQWWKLPERSPSDNIDVECLLDEVETLLIDAVKLRMRSDVPVGVLLSGGLDSSLIVACAAQSSTRPIKTFTMGIPGSGLDETAYADIVSKHFCTDHHLLELSTPSLDILDEIFPIIDEPIADSSLIPSYMVSKLTAQHVKVALGGDGGDELFGGYSDYTTAFADNARFGKIPPQLFRLNARLAARLPTGMRGRNRLSALRNGPFQSLVWGSPYFDDVARRRILNQDVVDALGLDFMAPEKFRYNLFQSGQDPVDAMTRTHFGSILPDDFLVKVDRSSMAVGLEMRTPFLDNYLVDFAFGQLPSEWKVSGKQGRRLERLLGKRLLPTALDINRKQGFSIPLDGWLRNPDGGRLDDIQDQLAPWINNKELRNLRAGHMAGRANGSRLFCLIMLDLFKRNML